jgi:hypothetical protein
VNDVLNSHTFGRAPSGAHSAEALSVPLEAPQSRRRRPRRTRRRGDGLRPERGYLPRRPAPDAQFSNLSHDSFRYVWNGRLPAGLIHAKGQLGQGWASSMGYQCRVRSIEHPCDVRGKVDRGGHGHPRRKRQWVRSRTTKSGTAVPLILPSLCRQPPRIRAKTSELSRMRIRRWRARTNKCEPSRTGLQSPCKRAVVSSILTGGSLRNALYLRRCRTGSLHGCSMSASGPRPSVVLFETGPAGFYGQEAITAPRYNSGLIQQRRSLIAAADR